MDSLKDSRRSGTFDAGTIDNSGRAREPQSIPVRAFRARATSRGTWGLAILLLMLSAPPGGRAQEEHKRKVPGVDKIISGSERQAFSGKVQSLDMNRKLLNVNTVQGGSTEVFPVSKGVRVTMANGEKMKLAKLAPGTDVIVYYEQKGDRRTVKEITVLEAAPKEEKKSPPRS